MALHALALGLPAVPRSRCKARCCPHLGSPCSIRPPQRLLPGFEEGPPLRCGLQQKGKKRQDKGCRRKLFVFAAAAKPQQVQVNQIAAWQLGGLQRISLGFWGGSCTAGPLTFSRSCRAAASASAALV